MRWSLLALAVVLAASLPGCPAPTSVVGDGGAADALPPPVRPDAELFDDATAPDAEPLDAEPTDGPVVDGGLVLLRGAIRPAATTARAGTHVLRGHLSVSSSTRARTREHTIEGGLGPLGY